MSRPWADAFHVEADLGADLPRDRFVVAGDHLHGHAMVVERADGGGGRVLRRIEEGQAAHGGEALLVRHAVGAVARRIAADGHDQHAQAVLVEATGHRADLGALLGRHRLGHVADASLAADRQHLLDRALADQQLLALPVRHDHRHAAALEVEGNLVHHVETVRHAARDRGGPARPCPSGCAGPSGSGC